MRNKRISSTIEVIQIKLNVVFIVDESTQNK